LFENTIIYSLRQLFYHPGKACERVLCYTTDPSIRNISAILKNGQDKVAPSEPSIESTAKQSGGISRGPAYYRRGGAHND